MSATFAVTVQPAARMRGRVRPPGDKSISHRYAMLAAIADGPSTIHGYSTGADCASTLACLRALGVPIDQVKRDLVSGLQLEVLGLQVGGLQPPSSKLDAGNSGSTMRMLSGILAAHPFRSTITGDDSLRGRPMRRIIVPLERMGARIIVDGWTSAAGDPGDRTGSRRSTSSPTCRARRSRARCCWPASTPRA